MKRVVSLFVFICLFSCFSSAGATSYMAGDANADSLVNAGDVVYLIGYLFRSGPPPVFWECGDPNTDCLVNAGDVVYLISYLFRQGPEPEIVECGWSEPVNLGPTINTDKGEYAISFSVDMKKLVLESNRSGTYGSSDIWYAEWDSLSGWGDLINCGPNVNTSLLEEAPCLSQAGDQIYLSYWNRPGGFGSWDIWVTSWDSMAGEWGLPENLGPNVNEDAMDRTPFVTSVETRLYFSSNRYFWGLSVCEWQGDGWGEAVWLGEVVNVDGTEEYPCLTADNSTMYFARWITSYLRRIYVTYWIGTEWSTPIELPPHINYPDVSTRAPWITPDSSKLYFVAYQRPGGMGGADIWISERIPVQKGKRFINRKISSAGKIR
jgi:hypothetical protein